jgi:hypothetical protein
MVVVPSSRTMYHIVPHTPLYGPTGTTVFNVNCGVGADAAEDPNGGSTVGRSGLVTLGGAALDMVWDWDERTAIWPRRSTVSRGKRTKSSPRERRNVEME